jgi:hypothetical protein
MWYTYLALIIFIFMVVSPVWFFRKLDEILFSDNRTEMTVEFINPLAVVKNTAPEIKLEREVQVLDRFGAAIASTTNPEMARIWKNHRNKYINNLRWTALEENSGGVEHISRTI